MEMMRDHYQETELDLSQDWAPGHLGFHTAGEE